VTRWNYQHHAVTRIREQRGFSFGVLRPDGKITPMDDFLAAMGDAGWELVAIGNSYQPGQSPGDTSHILYFKRPVDEMTADDLDD
jgi:hypothetical protein